MVDPFKQPLNTVPVAQAKAHFSEILARAASGQEVLITRRGVPVARLSGVERAKRPPRLKAIDTFRASLALTNERSVDLIRRMRDASY